MSVNKTVGYGFISVWSLQMAQMYEELRLYLGVLSFICLALMAVSADEP